MAFMQSPQTVLTTKYGTIRVRSIGRNRVMADIGDERSHAHHNDKTPAFTYRDSEFIGSVWFTIDETGSVNAEVGSGDVSISPRGVFTSAPRTYAAAMVNAMSESINAYLAEHPDFLRDGERAQVNNDLDRATEKRDGIAADLAEAERTVSELTARLAELNEHSTSDADILREIGMDSEAADLDEHLGGNF